MAKREWVDGEGYISGDSSFCGDDDMKTQYERISDGRFQTRHYPPVKVPPYKRLKHSVSGHVSVKSESQRAIKREPESEQDVVSFLKNRPQLAELQRTHTKSAPHPKLEMPRTTDGKGAIDLVKADHFKDHAAAWQQSETIDNFLHRLPVGDPSTAMVGPWLWVGSSTIPYAHSLRMKLEQTEIFIDGGVQLLQAFDLQRGKVEGNNPSKATANITRKLAPHRDQLEIDLLSLAMEMSLTTGKWMLFPDPHDIARVWRIIATATAEGRLGPVSKVGTLNSNEPNTLICIYSYDFSDLEDIRRVLNEIVDLGLCHSNAKPIYYKCDAYTHLGISSGNPYKLKASLYSSKNILRNEVKALQGGPVARLKLRNGETMTDFFRTSASDDNS